MGESGSGKSVLVRTIMNILPPSAEVPDDGEVLYDGRNVRNLNPVEAKHFWGTEMAMIFQDPMTSLNPVKRVGEQLTESIRFHLGLQQDLGHGPGPRPDAAGRHPRTPTAPRQYPHELSGGMRQRVMIAIALGVRAAPADRRRADHRPRRHRAEQILDLLERIQHERRMAMILITHDLGVVAGHADEVAVMYAGQFVEQAPTEASVRQRRAPLHGGVARLDPAGRPA